MQIREQAPTDRAADFPLAELEAIVQEMDAEQRQTVRLLEGGTYNVNIRRILGGETALMHPRTIDVWVVPGGLRHARHRRADRRRERTTG